MSGKLDQSLDEILSTQRRAAGGRRGGNRLRRPAGRPATTAPVGGVQKTSRQTRAAATKQTPAKAAGGHGESKVVVSNLVSFFFIADLVRRFDHNLLTSL